MKRIAFISILLSTLCFGCREDNNDPPLKGTRWKLVGLVNDQTGSLKELEPKDCEECFTLVFDSDYTATVRSIDHETYTLDLKHLTPDVVSNDMIHIELYDKDGKYYDTSNFRYHVIATNSYTVTPDGLILYLNSKYDNLLFKLQQP